MGTGRESNPGLNLHIDHAGLVCGELIAEKKAEHEAWMLQELHLVQGIPQPMNES